MPWQPHGKLGVGGLPRISIYQPWAGDARLGQPMIPSIEGLTVLGLPGMSSPGMGSRSAFMRDGEMERCFPPESIEFLKFCMSTRGFDLSYLSISPSFGPAF